MVTNLTDSILTTRANTGVATVEVETSQVMRTFVVIFTLTLLTRDKWVSLISSRALTGGSASCGDAVSIWSTRVGIAGVRLLLTASDCVRHGNIASYTLAHRVAQVVDITPGVWSTWAGETRIRWGSSGLYLGTTCDGVWLGGESWDAGAHGVTKSVNIALCVWTAGSRVARVGPWNTFIVLTNLIPTTVRVPFTLPATPCNCVWLGYIVRETAADWVAGACHRAFSVWSTWGGITRIWLLYTLVVLANISSTAVWVSLTLSLAASDCVRHGDVASQAPTDRVAQVICHAPCVRATG